MQVRKVHEFAAINVREQMHKLIGIVDDARAAGDLTTAMKGQMFIMKMFGFEDMPTLTHEMLGERGLQKSVPAQSGGQDEPRNVLQFSRVHQELDRLIAARTIEHDPQKN
ncbi:MAG: hypothetical protein KF810_15985 [Rhizobiaceae bacterium]|nr:hypothetical protein [Rhizobiaceae bacterium]